jgi:hypothetical protein
VLAGAFIVLNLWLAVIANKYQEAAEDDEEGGEEEEEDSGNDKDKDKDDDKVDDIEDGEPTAVVPDQKQDGISPQQAAAMARRRMTLTHTGLLSVRRASRAVRVSIDSQDASLVPPDGGDLFEYAHVVQVYPFVSE